MTGSGSPGKKLIFYFKTKCELYGSGDSHLIDEQAESSEEQQQLLHILLAVSCDGFSRRHHVRNARLDHGKNRDIYQQNSVNFFIPYRYLLPIDRQYNLYLTK